MLFYLKNADQRLPWHIGLGELPLSSLPSAANNHRRYKTNVFCGRKFIGWYWASGRASHDISTEPPSSKIELCQQCLKQYETRTGKSFDIV